MLTWWERPGDSYAEHEAAQRRILGIFEKWEIPESLTFHQFLVRVGEFGGYAVVETDDLAEIEKVIATYAMFQFRLEPVLDVADAVAARRRASLGARTTRQASVAEGGVFCWPRNQPEPSRSDPIGGGPKAGSSSGPAVLLPAPVHPRAWEVDNANFAMTEFSEGRLKE